jgi:hypothetical protein
MNNVGGTLKRGLGIGLSWAILWLALWSIIAAIIDAVQPDNFDPGEGTMFVVIFGSMGLLSGLAFGALLLAASRRQTTIDLSMIRTTGIGILGCALAQIPYLGHGDLGLAANIQMALLFSAVGGIVTMGWVVLARWRSRHGAGFAAASE